MVSGQPYLFLRFASSSVCVHYRAHRLYFVCFHYQLQMVLLRYSLNFYMTMSKNVINASLVE